MPAGLAPSEKSDAKEYLNTLCRRVRERRQPLEQEMLLAWACWKGQKTRWYYLDGVSDHYIKVAARQVEKFVRRCRRQLTPSQEFFEVYPWDESAPDGSGAENVRAYLLYCLTARMRFRAWIEQAIRSFCLYGRAITESLVEVVAVPVPMGGKWQTIYQIWPKSRNVDPFSWYFWPETATCVDEMHLMFEDVMVTYEEYERFSKGRGAVADSIAKDDVFSPEWPIHQQVRMAGAGLTDPSNTGGTPPGGSGSGFISLTKAFYRVSGQWALAWMVWNARGGPRLVRYEKPPRVLFPTYRIAFDRQHPGEGYSSGMMGDLEPLNVWFNDQVNMFGDAQMTAMSPPTIVNPQMVYREDSLQFRPRAKWLADPNGIVFGKPPDVTSAGIQGIQATAGFIQDFGLAGGLADGTPQRGMPRAGFAVSSLINLSMSDISSVAETLEDDILTPTLSDMFRLGMMFTPQNQWLRIPAVMGLPSRGIQVEQLAGDWTFRWVGSIQSNDYMVKSQKLITMFAQLAKAAPLINQAGLQVQWDLLAKRIWREGLGERGAESILKKMTPQDAMLSMLMAMGPQIMKQMAGGGGEGGNPATPEEAERTMSRGMGESQVGQLMGGLGGG